MATTMAITMAITKDGISMVMGFPSIWNFHRYGISIDMKFPSLWDFHRYGISIIMGFPSPKFDSNNKMGIICDSRRHPPDLSCIFFFRSIHLSNNSIQKNYKNGERAEELPDENMWTSEDFREYLEYVQENSHPPASTK